MTPDFAVFSYPKCGRTWVRFLLAAYLDRFYALGLDVDFHSVFRLLPNYSNDPQRGIAAFAYAARADVPKIVFSHLAVEPDLPVPVIFLSRCPLDTLVSEYFQKKNRQQVFAGSIAEFLRGAQGVAGLCRYYNHSCASLATMLASRPAGRVLRLSYEQLHHDTRDSLRQLLAMVRVPFDDSIADVAIRQSSFERMQKVEVDKGFPSAQIKGQAGDPNALRAREGKIGSYRNHLDEADVQFAGAYLRTHLDPAVFEVLPDLLAQVD